MADSLSELLNSEEEIFNEDTPAAREGTRYWRLSPGEQGKWWDTLKREGHCAIGWPALGDVRVMTWQEIEHRRAEIVGDPRFQSVAHRYTPDSVKQVWRFTHEIKIGDWVLSNRGKSEVLGWGIVTGPCEFHLENKEFPNQIPIRWMKFEPRKIMKENWVRSLNELTREKFLMLIGGANDAREEPNGGVIQAMRATEPLNQILYGPPGTGKTYNAIARAVEIIDGQKYSDRAQLKARFEELKRAGQISFVTFHQSFGYEDFIEGIRPVLDESTSDGARYECRDGIFKDMAMEALGAAVQPLATGHATFAQLWDAFVKRVNDEPEWELPGLGSSKYQISFTPTGVKGENTAGKAVSPYNASRYIVEKVWEELPHHEKPTLNAVAGIISKGAHYNFYAAIINELRRLEPAGVPQEIVKDEPVNIARAFLRGSARYVFCKQDEQPHYVLIIDEINRGNISKILGELITLLEADKRIGAPNELKVTLPYSGEEFGLPQNLFLVGTMNTADKSLALLDIALRRRFKFFEYPPDFEVCDGLSGEMRKVLSALNHRITIRKDRDHRIGHSFFIEVRSAADFNNVFRSEIIPLLQEYFFNDWDGLRFVLGENGQTERFVRSLEKTPSRGARNRWRWFFDDYPNAQLDCLEALLLNYAQSDIGQTGDEDISDDAD